MIELFKKKVEMEICYGFNRKLEEKNGMEELQLRLEEGLRGSFFVDRADLGDSL